MSAIGVFDVVSTAGFAIAFVAALLLPVGEGRRIERRAKLVLVLALGIYAFVGISNSFEHLGITTSGDIVEDYIEITFFALLAYVAYSVDTSERIATLAGAQEDLRRERDLTASVINASPAAIVMLDAAGSVGFASEHLRTLFGLGPEDRLATQDLWLKPYGRAAGEGPRQTIADVAAQAPFHDELFFVDDTDRIVSVSAEKTDSEHDSKTVLALVDVTQRLLADEELAAYRQDLEGLIEKRTHELTEANERLERTDRAKREFLAKLSHELRTPLNSIMGFTSVILRGMAGTITAEQRTQLEMIENASKRLLSLVTDILDVSKIETGQAAVSMRPVSLHPVLACVVGEQRTLAEERGVKLEFTNESTRPEVRTDADKVEQIVSNLVNNALRFTPKGGTVTVTLADVTDAVLISVADTGTGLSPREKDRVFESFEDAEDALPEYREGAGLGWAIARELSDLIGARISVSSAPGQGSTFMVKIPLV